MVSLLIGRARFLLSNIFLLVVSLYLALLSASFSALSSGQTQEDISAVKASYSYQDVKPVFDRKCIACHGCYDAPCQLKLESPQGLQRGATKQLVYDGTRLKDAPPTRLHVDALTPAGWRNKGFHSVLAPVVKSSLFKEPQSILRHLVELGRRQPVAVNKPLSDDYRIGIYRDNDCASSDEFNQYLEENPKGGMPYGVVGLTDREYHKLTTWLKQGAPIESHEPSLSSEIRAQIANWEKFFNGADKREQLVARYLYEHLFLAHLYFKDNSQQQYFRLVRSITAAPEPVIPVATVKPYGDPEGKFYYRLMPITDTIVHKTHIVYGLDDNRMERYRKLFLSGNWQLDELPGYSYEFASNPFLTFAAIPAKSRYQFMLDEAEYFVRTFIRGPVCRGQIATDVIRDQFWIMFENPDIDQFVNVNDYQQDVIRFLGLPGENSDLQALGPAWLKYSKKRNKYLEKRQKQYRKAFPDGAALPHVWDGDTHNTNAFLTIFRHHNSATVTRGWLGALPLTLWMMDYPLFERTYYELVVGFNVFGSVSHQAQTRLYFDLIRNGGETNFLRLIPAKYRGDEYNSWYLYSGLIKKLISYHELDDKSPSQVPIRHKGAAKADVVAAIRKANARLIPNDPLNPPKQCGKPCDWHGGEEPSDPVIRELARLTVDPAKRISGILQLPEVSFLRVDEADKDYRVFTLIRNRAHSNVAFMLGEQLRYEPKKDTVTVAAEPLGSYPNFIFRVPAEHIKAFVDQLMTISNESERNSLVNRWGVRRTHPDFWQIFHSVSDYVRKKNPHQAGVYDLNRYTGW